jgi:hypothetical protein
MRASIRCALTLVIFSTASCHSMRPVSVAQVTANHRAWLTLSDKSVVVVDGPQIYGTKVVGFVNGKYEEFPAAQVQEVHVREPARVRTAALIALSGLTAGGLLFLLTEAGHGNPGLPDICDEEPENILCVQ